MTFHLGGMGRSRHRVEEFSAACVPLSWRVRLWYDSKVNPGVTTLTDLQQVIVKPKTV